jgi:hypothetical protein
MLQELIEYNEGREDLLIAISTIIIIKIVIIIEIIIEMTNLIIDIKESINNAL